MATKWSVDCWNCNEGYVDDVDWEGFDIEAPCSICRGKGFLIVTQLTDDNCEAAIPLD